MAASDAQIIVEVGARLDGLDRGLKQAEAKTQASASRMDATLKRSSQTQNTYLAGITKRMLGVGAAFALVNVAARSFARQFEENAINPVRTWGETFVDAVDEVADSFAILRLGKLFLPGYTDMRQEEARRQQSTAIGAATLEAEFARKVAEAPTFEDRKRMEAAREISRIQRNALRMIEQDQISGAGLTGQIQAMERAQIAAVTAQLKASLEQQKQATTTASQPQGDPIMSYGTAFGEYRVGPLGGTTNTRRAEEEIKRASKRTADATSRSERHLRRISSSLKGFN